MSAFRVICDVAGVLIGAWIGVRMGRAERD